MKTDEVKPKNSSNFLLLAEQSSSRADKYFKLFAISYCKISGVDSESLLRVSSSRNSSRSSFPVPRLLLCMVSDHLPPTSSSSSADFSENVILLSEDEKQLTVSRRFLASEAGYFRALFTRNFRDSKKDSFKLWYSAEVIAEVISSLQKTIAEEVPIWSLARSCDLINPVTYLQVDRLLPLIQKSIIQQVDVVNLLAIYRYAYQRDVQLARMLWELVLKHFNKLAESEEYLKMQQEELAHAMMDEKLAIDSRLEAVVIRDYLKKHPNSPAVQRLSRQISHNDGDGVLFPVVMNRVPRDILVATGGWSSHGPTEVVEIFNPRNEQWIRAPMLMDERKAYHSLSRQDNKLFICGGMNGREYYRTVKYYDLDTRAWEYLPELVERRCYGNTVSIPFTDGSSQLMMIGGYNGTERLSSCELVAPPSEKNCWRMVKSMSKPRSDGAAALVADGVVAIGGFDGRTVHQDGEIYDLTTNSWLPLNRRMQHPRTGTTAVTLNRTTFMVAGGFNGSTRLSTVEFYDTREGRWHTLPKMHTTRSNFALEHVNGQVYAVGGFDGVTTTAHCEKFDCVAQRWSAMSDLAVSRSALKLCRVTDHNIIRDLVNFDDVGGG